MTTWRALGCLAVGLTAALSAGCSVNPATGRRQLSLISESQEVQMGAEAAGQFETEFGGRVADPRLQQYVQGLGGRVAAASERAHLPWEFALLASDVPNAFALPGGRVYVTAGLFRRMDNERQLLAALGHEVGHVAARHNVERLQQAMGASLFAQVLGQLAGGGGAAVEAGSKVAANMVVLKYSRRDETEADALGIRYMERVGANPWGMVELLEVLGDLGGGREPGRLGAMLRSHPLPSSRIKDARELLTEHYRAHSPAQPDPNAATFRAMHRLLPPG